MFVDDKKMTSVSDLKHFMQESRAKLVDHGINLKKM
jgi:hypothetical protein